MAHECRRVWTPTCFPTSEGHERAANCACLTTSFRTASRPRAPPVGEGKIESSGSPPRSLSHVRSVSTLCALSGVTRSFRPLPLTRTWAPRPVATSMRRNPASSETRSPVWMATARRAWSRRPVHLVRSGAASKASISPVVRKVTSGRSPRFYGMASTLAMRSACSGWRNEA